MGTVIFLTNFLFFCIYTGALGSGTKRFVKIALTHLIFRLSFRWDDRGILLDEDAFVSVDPQGTMTARFIAI